jgi:hypothetical protein
MSTPVDMAPIKRICGARNRRGEACGCKKLYLKKNGRYRCRFHGGLRDGRRLEVEVKRRGEQPTDEQRVFLDRIRKAGGVAILAHGVSDVIATLGPTCPRTRRSV